MIKKIRESKDAYETQEYNKDNKVFAVNHKGNKDRIVTFGNKEETKDRAEYLNSLSERYLQEGPGAGYTVKGEIDKVVSVNSFEVDDKEFKGTYTPLGSDESIEYYTVDVNCNIDVLLSSISIESYYYGGLIEDAIPAKVNFIRLYGVDEGVEITKDILDSAIRTINQFEVSLGGGWSHSTFDGIISTDDIDEANYYDENSSKFEYVEFIEIQLEDQNAITYLDKACTGDNTVILYDVIEDDELVDSFDDEDAAIEFAKTCDGTDVEVEANEFVEYYNGDLDPTNYSETVWQKGFEESFKRSTHHKRKRESVRIKESTEIDRQLFKSLVKLDDGEYSILNDGYFVKKIFAETDTDAIKEFRKYLGKQFEDISNEKPIYKVYYIDETRYPHTSEGYVYVHADSVEDAMEKAFDEPEFCSDEVFITGIEDENGNEYDDLGQPMSYVNNESLMRETIQYPVKQGIDVTVIYVDSNGEQVEDYYTPDKQYTSESNLKTAISEFFGISNEDILSISI